MKRLKKIQKKWLILLLIVLVVGVLMLVSVSRYFSSGGTLPLAQLLPADTQKLLALLLLALPVLLLLLLGVVLLVRDKDEDSQVQTLIAPETVYAAENLPGTASADTREEETDATAERFCMLCEIDRKSTSYGHQSYEKGVTLESFCRNFRNYAASQLKLYYDIGDIRQFIAGLAVSKLVILQGMSGTGKTSLAHAFGSFTDNGSTVIPVQPMWKERTDLIGYYNEFTKRFNETLLLEKMYEANYSADMYITVLDEMNIARVEYYFAEFLSLLELPDPNERFLEVVSDKWDTDPRQFIDGRILLPRNMWFIGTANNDDSTFAISDKVYDRAMILNLDTKSERFSAPATSKCPISAQQFGELVDNAIKEFGISKRNLARLEVMDQYLIDHFHITFGNRIMKQIKTYIPVYVACGGDELTALDDILAKKVIRKLETQNPIYLRNASENLLSFIDELFGDDKMSLCKEYIIRLQRNA